MKTKKLGNTELEISAIGMGNAHHPYNDPCILEKQALMIEFADCLGINFIDTAEQYGNGLSEKIIGKVSPIAKKNFCVCTKVSPNHLQPEELKSAVENSLFRLKVDHIDLYYIHWPNPNIPIEQTMQAMDQLVDEGKIRYIGLSNFSLKEIKEAKKATSKGISAIQLEYSLIDRGVEEKVLPFCQINDITFVAYSPLDQGDLVRKKEKILLLRSIATKYQKTPAQIILNWLITHQNVVAIPKTGNPRHLVDNATSTDFVLENIDIKLIEDSFPSKAVEVPVEQIQVILEGRCNRQAYQTLEEAKQNLLNFTPSPEELALGVKEEGLLKPVSVVLNTDENSKYKYNLIEGRIRYWAWVIAFEGQKSIPVIIR